MGILDGKRILVTGVLTDDSLAFGVARLALEQGAEIVLTGAGRGMGLTQRVARRLPSEPDVLELDVTQPDHVALVRDRLAEKWGSIDGALHAIGFAPPSCLGGGFIEAPWEDVAVAFHVSTYSLKVLADVVVPLMEPAGGGSIVGLDFDNSTMAFPAYDWMGVAKAALQSTARYLARDLGPKGIRVNLIAAGPIRTVAAKSIPAFAQFEEVWAERAPLGWDVKADHESVGRACVALLSDWFPKTTGEVVHVDGGFHAVGA
jgi:enoyl-[acyl-carrier protein] reductase I